jgi:hypothetical protein
MKNNCSKLPLSVAIMIAMTCSLTLAQDEPLPENPGIAGPDQGDIEAQQGMNIEEGLAPEEAPEVNEAQQSFENNKAEEELEIEKEKADAEKEEADTEYNESFEPEEPVAVEGGTVVEPEARIVEP